jgi:xylulokinase
VRGSVDSPSPIGHIFVHPFIGHNADISMTVLGLDIGSSSVKAALLRGTRVYGEIAREHFKTRYDGTRAEAEPQLIIRAIARAIRSIGAGARSVDAIALSVMSPAWIAMDQHGKPLTPLITHQDRRSVDVAVELEKRIGKDRHLRLVGNRPVPGGISSTTWAWFKRHEPRLMRKADLVGHLNTFLLMQLTHARLVDPSNASFMGLLKLDQSGWSEEICDAIGASELQLPQIVSADAVGGLVTHAAARKFGLTHGTPVLTGLIDTGSAMLLAGAKPGQLVNVAGSTDVLALCVDRPRPHERLITRALGVEKKWLSVSTLAAAGSSFRWVREQLFREQSDLAFAKMMRKLAKTAPKSGIRFDPYLAGDRMSIEQRRAALTGLTLASSREEILSAVIEAITGASAERLELLKQVNGRIDHRVIVSGGVVEATGDLLHRDWRGKWTFRFEDEASLRGLGKLV